MQSKKIFVVFRNIVVGIKKFDAFLVFLTCAFLFTLLQLHSTFPDPDSFYHARIASMMVSGPVMNFSWLPLTALSQYFIDHHFLYHVLLIPFVTLFDPLVGLKIATVLFASGFLTLFYMYLKKFPAAPILSRGQALFFLCFLALNTMFMFRLNLGKIPAVSLFIFFCGLYAIAKLRLKALFGLSFLFVWMYGGWPLLPATACVAWIIRAGCETKSELRITNYELRKILTSFSFYIKNYIAVLFSWEHIKLPATAISGALCGLIFNPYFPTNISFYWIQTVKIAVLNSISNVSVGGEWYPAGITFIPSHGPTLILLVFSLCAFILPGIFSSYSKRGDHGRTWQQWMLCVLTLILLFLTLKSRRYGEYFAPIATLFCAQVLEPFMHKARILQFFSFLKKNLPKIFSFNGILALYAVIIIPAIIVTNILQVVAVYRGGYTFGQYKQGMAWLGTNTPEDSLIFHHRWDDFPLFFYHNRHNTYISGLDPRFLVEGNKNLAEGYAKITEGSDITELYGIRSACLAAEKNLEKVESTGVPMLHVPSSCFPVQEKRNMAAELKNFNAAYIVATHLDEPFNEKVRGIPGLNEVYRDTEMVIYSINSTIMQAMKSPS